MNQPLNQCTEYSIGSYVNLRIAQLLATEQHLTSDRKEEAQEQNY